VQLAAGEHGLEQVAGVHRAVGLARADDGVELVDEEQDAALGGLHFGEHRLEAFLEFAAVFGAGDQRSHVDHVEREHGLVLEALGHVAAHDALGQALDDGGLAHARFADEHGVVLGLARKDADGAADLVVAPDDRVHFALPGLGAQVEPVLGERVVGGFGIVRGHALAAAGRLEGREDLGAIEAEGLEVFGERLRARDLDEAEEEVLGGHELILELLRLGFGPGQRIVHRLGDENFRLVGAAGAGREASQLALGGELQRGHGQPGLVDQRGNDAVFLGKQSEEQMPRIHLDMAVPTGDSLRLGESGAGHLGKGFGIHMPLASQAADQPPGSSFQREIMTLSWANAAALTQRRARDGSSRHGDDDPETKTVRARRGVFKANNIPYAFALLAP
jgi:hypothetical protein